jgi:hypothetical protein
MATLYRPLLPPQERHEAVQSAFWDEVQPPASSGLAAHPAALPASGAVASLPAGAFPKLPETLPGPAAATPGRAVWQLPPRGLVLFHGAGEITRLSHYFLPRLLREGRRVLFLDGANCADPRLMARFARERGEDFHVFSRHIRIARAFTCFQLTEMAARVPQMLAEFPAQVLMVTALPELYFDEDVRDSDARASFRSALALLRRWSGLDAAAPVRSPLAVALFSAASGFHPPPARRGFMRDVLAAAPEAWQFCLDAQQRLRLVWGRPQAGLAPRAAPNPAAPGRARREGSGAR